jgi:probable F420-dependent oxidoreductase
MTINSFGISIPSAGAMASPENMRAVVQAAERFGYESVWVSDHVIAPEKPDSVYPYGGGGPFAAPGAGTYYEPLTTLAWIAGGTERVRLGISVLVIPLRNPVYAAKTIATLDALSGGRVILGIGVGWLNEEFEALGETRFAQRGPITDEWIEIYRKLWAQDAVASHAGAHYQFGPLRSAPKPAQRPMQQGQRWPGPPVWVGGNTRPALRRTARLGDGWQGLRTTVDETRACLEQLQEMLAQVGRTREELTISSRLNVSVKANPDATLDYDIAGDPDLAAERVGRYQALGCSDFMLIAQPRDSVPGMIESLEWFATEVRPRVQEATPASGGR